MRQAAIGINSPQLRFLLHCSYLTMSSTASKTSPPVAEWQKLRADLKRTQAQLGGQLRRLETLLQLADAMIDEAEKREAGALACTDCGRSLDCPCILRLTN